MRGPALMGILCAAAIVSLFRGPAANAAPPSALEDVAVLERFLHPPGPMLRSYRARRTLEASSMGGRMRAAIEAWTALDEDGRFHFDIIHEEGSSLVRNRVLREALETERRSYETDQRERATLVTRNYVFRLVGHAGEGRVAIALSPRRRDPMLLNGVVTVKSETGAVEELNGSLSQMPSWWTTHVTVGQRYARVNQVNVPVEMWSEADVRVGGESHFRMAYQYESVNGQPVPRR